MKSLLLTAAVAAGVAAASGTAAPPQNAGGQNAAAPNIQVTPPATDPAVERGRYLVVLGDCSGCHTRPGGQPFTGGLPLATPFGTIYSSNLTPDSDTGLGGWTADQFYRAMHEGKRNDGANLYPAFPYPYFTHVTRVDSDAILAYLKSLPAVNYRPPVNKLPFPINIRAVVKIWNWLNFRRDDDGKVASGSHGGYLVEGLAHCGGCHTPKTFLAGDKTKDAYRGGVLDNWFAPNLRSESGGGLKDWNEADITEFLKTGRNAKTNAGGAMTNVITHSTSQMTDQDLAAIAAYLKTLPAQTPKAPPAPDAAVMKAGEAIYVDECAACHKADGTGVPRLFPPLGGNANVQASNPSTLGRFILSGTQSATTSVRPTASSMPAFGWKLTDAEAAAVATYVRNSWGNAGAAIGAKQMGKIRKAVAAEPVRKPSAKI